jgi:hypothetical protein
MQEYFFMSKNTATSGFVYIWYDRKHKRYYIGSHWGTEDDGYICSSRWMKKSYKRRPHDFKRRILSKVNTTRLDLLVEEGKWLAMIKIEEVSIRYYNQRTDTFKMWHSDEQKRSIVGEKISRKNKGMKLEFKDPVERGKNISEAKKKAFEKRINETGSAFSEDHKQKLATAHSGKTHTDEWKADQSDRLKQQWNDGIRIPRPKKEVTLRKPGERLKELWADPVWAENQKKKLTEGSRKRFNKDT